MSALLLLAVLAVLARRSPRLALAVAVVLVAALAPPAAFTVAARSRSDWPPCSYSPASHR